MFENSNPAEKHMKGVITKNNLIAPLIPINIKTAHEIITIVSGFISFFNFGMRLAIKDIMPNKDNVKNVSPVPFIKSWIDVCLFSATVKPTLSLPNGFIIC